MSGSTTKTFFTLARQPNTAAIAFCASPGTRCLSLDAHVVVAAAGRGRIDAARFAHGGLQRAPDDHFGAQRAELRGVGVARRLPLMLAVWNSASRRCVIAVRWKTGLFFTPP